MSRSLISRLKNLRSRPLVRGFWFVLALLVLGVQTAMPAHEETHALGAPDTACQFCMQGGHLSGMPEVVPPAPLATARMETPLPVETGFSVEPQTRTHFSRGPPSTPDA